MARQTRPMTASDPSWPRIRTVGIDGMLVSFGDTLREEANRAALAFRAAVDREAWDGVEETATSLASTFVRFDPLILRHDTLRERLHRLLGAMNWYAADLPRGRRLFHIPTVFGTDLAPQLSEAAQAAGLSETEAIASITANRVRVQTIGFAPGQPYLGTLPDAWNIPRQQDLTPRVTEGALVVAIRQLVLFSVTAPTGWRHIGQTACRLFRPQSDTPFLLRPGDEVQFHAITREEYDVISTDTSNGGITQECLA